jgi:hypothetical protein
VLAAAGVDVSDLGRLARVFRRPGGFAELSDPEAARLAMAGIDVYSPVQASALARAFKRSGPDWAELSAEERGRLVLAGIDLDDIKVAGAVTILFKRPGGFVDPGEETAASPSTQASHEAGKHALVADPLRHFQRGQGGGEEYEDADEQITVPGGSGQNAEQIEAGLRHERFFKRGNQLYDDSDGDSDGAPLPCLATMMRPFMQSILNNDIFAISPFANHPWHL